MVNINATLIAQILNFLVLVFVLAKFVYKPVLGIMEERKNKIASDLETAEMAKKDAEAVKAEYAAKLADARQEAQAIIENALRQHESDVFAFLCREVLSYVENDLLEKFSVGQFFLDVLLKGRIEKKVFNVLFSGLKCL